ncbi:hypothetical protein V8E54_005961 [Elaphomyces granulatus]
MFVEGGQPNSLGFVPFVEIMECDWASFSSDAKSMQDVPANPSKDVAVEASRTLANWETGMMRIMGLIKPVPARRLINWVCGSHMKLTGKQKLTRLVNFHVSAIVMIKVIIFMCTSMGLLNDAGIVVDPTQIAEFY